MRTIVETLRTRKMLKLGREYVILSNNFLVINRSKYRENELLKKKEKTLSTTPFQ